MFWVKHQFISACFKHTGKKKHTKEDFSIIFSQILLFPTRTFFMVLQHTHMFPKTENGTYKGAFWTNTHRDSEVDF